MKKLDYELKTIYRITVRARDNGTIPLKSNCDLVVSSVVPCVNYMPLCVRSCGSKENSQKI